MVRRKNEYEKRQYVVGGLVLLVVLVYIFRLASLQLMGDYVQAADSNAQLRRVLYPARGSIYDRTGCLMVYDEASYDIMVVMKEQEGVDTMALCECLGMTKQEYIDRMAEISDVIKHPSYSKHTQQLFLSQISSREFSRFQEEQFRYRGFYIQKRSVRQYATPYAAHILGDVGEVSEREVETDPYYRGGDYIGKTGVERSYEEVLRGRKGQEVLLRDARGRTKGSYQHGRLDTLPIVGRDLTLSIDLKLQALGEKLMKHKLGSIVAIEPSTGEILCMVSSPSYDPKALSGKMRGKNSYYLQIDPLKPLLNRAIQGTYPPGSTFKTSQGLTFLQEGIIDTLTLYPCSRGFRCAGNKVGCHGHPAPIRLIPAVATSCNGYFCWGLYYMLSNDAKYGTIQNAMTRWKDYMVSMGFGYPLGVDLPGEKRGMIPNANYYDDHLGAWNPLSVISIAIGQGEVTLTPLQIANLGATIANRGYFIRPHVVKRVSGLPLDTAYTNKHYTMVDQKYYELIARGMRAAVRGGTCKRANTTMYEVCGKTGTAQNRGHDHSAFMGFAPMKNPQIAIAVYVENGGFGATFGVPIGALMMEQYIRGKLSERSEKTAEQISNKKIAYGDEER